MVFKYAANRSDLYIKLTIELCVFYHLGPNKEYDGVFKLANVEEGLAFHQHGSHVFLIEIQCHVSSLQC